MALANRRSGFSLVAIGLLGIGFFWVTDPRWGEALRWNRGENPIDLANQAFPGTVVGVIGSALITVTGIYLLSRRAL